jgi:hypothetical protein
LYHESVAVLVSLGCGIAPEISVPPRGFVLSPLEIIKRCFPVMVSHLGLLLDEVTSAEFTHETVQRGFPTATQRVYFRFNPRLQSSAQLDIANLKELEHLVDITRDYLGSEEVEQDLNELFKLLG